LWNRKRRKIGERHLIEERKKTEMGQGKGGRRKS
jgi:hypothetical protein